MLLDHVTGIIPRWMLDAANIQYSRLMRTLASLGDTMTEAILEARFAAFPGQLDVPGGNGFDNFDALPYIGRNVSIRQGLLESDFAYASRLRAQADEWARSATPFELLNQLAAILSPSPPVLRLVNGSGTWWDRDQQGALIQYTAKGTGVSYRPSDGSTTAVATLAEPWDWDSGANPLPFGFGDDQRFWVIIYAPCNGIYLSGISGLIGDGRTIGMGKGGPDAATIGTVAPSKEVELIRIIVQEWRAAGLRCSHIIIAFDTPINVFNPDGTSPDYPDGTWGWPDKVVGGNMVPARPSYARYWRAEPGGVAGTL